MSKHITIEKFKEEMYNCTSKNVLEKIIEMYREDRFILRFLTKRIRSSPNIMKDLIDINPEAYRYVCGELIKDTEFARYTVQKDGKTLYYMSEKHRQNRDIVLAAVSENGDAFYHSRGSFFDDLQIVLTSIFTCQEFPTHIFKPYFSNETIPKHLEDIPVCYYIDPILHEHPDVIRAAEIYNSQDKTLLNYFRKAIAVGVPITGDLDLIIEKFGTLYCADLGGNNFEVEDWLNEPDLISKLLESNPELGDFNLVSLETKYSSENPNPFTRTYLTSPDKCVLLVYK